MRHRRTDHNFFTHAKQLRRSPTEAENRLWHFLRMHQLDGVHFRRQHALGPYIVDFCSPRYKIIIEIDGGQHLDQEAYDGKRTAFLEAKGYQVLRFWNNEVLQNIDAVYQVICNALAEKRKEPPPNLPQNQHYRFWGRSNAQDVIMASNVDYKDRLIRNQPAHFSHFLQ
jgi:very-short-patch-repair endonuclease